MQLTRKLTLAFVLAVLVVLGINAAIRVQREGALIKADIRRDGHVLGRAISVAVSRVWSTVGEAQALDLVEHANERESHVLIRFVWLDASDGDRHAPAVDRALLADVARGREQSLRTTIPGQQQEAIYTYAPVRTPSGRRGAIELRESLEDVRRYTQRTLMTILLTTLALLALFAALAWGLGVYFIGRPIQHLVVKARRVGAGDLSGDLQLRQRDEIGSLAREMNAMCRQLQDAHERTAQETEKRIAALAQLRHADRLMMVGKLASGIAHEIGTPLNVISGRAELIRDSSAAGSEAHENARIIGDYARRVAGIIRQLLDFARRAPARRSTLELRAVVEQAAQMLSPLAARSRVTLELRISDENLRTSMDPAQMQQAITNLVVNGVQAMPQGGVLQLSLSAEEATPPPEHGGAPARFACLAITDHGTGMDADTMDHIFEPFFTTKDVGEGTGLGLSVTLGIVQEHQGWIRVESTPGAGSTFKVFLPLEAA